MNSKPPEMTIFQGMPSLHIDNNKITREEEEAIKDQARLQKEVNLKFKTFKIFLSKMSLIFSYMQN